MKDLLLYRLVRRAYEPNLTGVARLLGVRGELWRAVVSPADGGITSGTEVEIMSAERMEVFVRVVEAEPRN